jgi:hypothetical protein
MTGPADRQVMAAREVATRVPLATALVRRATVRPVRREARRVTVAADTAHRVTAEARRIARRPVAAAMRLRVVADIPPAAGTLRAAEAIPAVVVAADVRLADITKAAFACVR